MYLASHLILRILRSLSILRIVIALLCWLRIIIETDTVILLLGRRLTLGGHISHLVRLLLV